MHRGSFTMAYRETAAPETVVAPYSEHLAYPIPFAVLCGQSNTAHKVTTLLERQGFVSDPHADIQIILSIPVCFALRALEAGLYAHRSLVILTWHTSPEHLEDLWEYAPQVLLHVKDEDRIDNLPDLVQRAARNERYRTSSQSTVLLTAAQRRVLRGVARGWSDARIAEHLCVSPRTVMNRVSETLSLFGFANRTELALYYWGIDTDSGSFLP